jgi:hypothetical protein
MLIRKGIPKPDIEKLTVGDFFVDGRIVSIHKCDFLITIVTDAGSVFNAHRKEHSYNLFQKSRRKKA